METIGFFHIPFSPNSEPSSTPRQPKQNASSNPPQPQPNRSQAVDPLADEIEEMAHNPVFWMMP